MPDTKMYRRSSDGSCSDQTEIQRRIPCQGKSAQTVLEEIREALTVAEMRDADPLIVLENLGQLQDSVTTLIKSISRLLVGYPRSVTFWESSGYTEAFLAVMEGPKADR